MTKHTNRSASLSFFFFADRFVFFVDGIASGRTVRESRGRAQQRGEEESRGPPTAQDTEPRSFFFLQVGERGSWRGVVTPPLVCSQTRLVPTHPRPTVWRSPCFLFVFRSAVARPFFCPFSPRLPPFRILFLSSSVLAVSSPFAFVRYWTAVAAFFFLLV